MNDEDRKRLPPRARQFIARARALQNAMRLWVQHDGRVTGSAGGPGDGFTEVRFAWDQGKDRPRAELILQADVDDSDAPTIRVIYPEGLAPPEVEPEEHRVVSTASSCAPMFGTERSPVEPDQQCEACGAQGTVGRAVRFTRDGAVDEMHRFCAACWPEEMARYGARWRIDNRRQLEEFRRGGGTGGWSGQSAAFESATWDFAEEHVEQLRARSDRQRRLTRRELQGVADELFDTRDSRVGEMPLEVAAFIQQHTSRTLPPEFLRG